MLTLNQSLWINTEKIVQLQCNVLFCRGMMMLMIIMYVIQTPLYVSNLNRRVVYTTIANTILNRTIKLHISHCAWFRVTLWFNVTKCERGKISSTNSIQIPSEMYFTEKWTYRHCNTHTELCAYCIHMIGEMFFFSFFLQKVERTLIHFIYG